MNSQNPHPETIKLKERIEELLNDILIHRVTIGEGIQCFSCAENPMVPPAADGSREFIFGSIVIGRYTEDDAKRFGHYVEGFMQDDMNRGVRNVLQNDRGFLDNPSESGAKTEEGGAS